MPLVASTLEILDATPLTLRAMLVGLPDHVVNMPGEGGWSPRDVLVHLASRQQPAFAERVRAIVTQDHPLLPDIPDDVAAAGFDADRPVADMIDDFASGRNDAMQFVRSLDDDQLARTGRHEVAGEVSAADIIHHIAYHDLVHLAQIAELLRDPVDRARGAMRRFQ